MILSASKRTDIPALYHRWFLSRIEEGYLLVANPRDHIRARRVELSPETIDAIVFWSKDPLPMHAGFSRLDGLGYRWYLQFTLNGYDRSIEPGLPAVEERVKTLRTLADCYGRQRIVWRYDPIILTEELTVDYHIDRFNYLAARLSGSFSHCMISFLDLYPQAIRRMTNHRLLPPTAPRVQELASAFGTIARREGFRILSCAESIELGAYGIDHGACVDRSMIEGLCGYRLATKKDPNAREGCGCIRHLDIGTYESCIHRCSYCYAVKDFQRAREAYTAHDPSSPMLNRRLSEELLITDKEISSDRSLDRELFE